MPKNSYTLENGQYPDLTTSQVKHLQAEKLIVVFGEDCYFAPEIKYINIELAIKGLKTP
jgi:hypothetical protein